MSAVDQPRPGSRAPSPGPPAGGEEWVGLSGERLPVAEAGEWLVRPDCGATVVFTGTARDHSVGRAGVDLLVYEAYDEHAVRKMAEVVAEARRRWPGLGRIVVVHRTGEVPVGEAAVVVGASAGHREEAFTAARWLIDAVKSTVPVWKRERWEGGDDWGIDGADLLDARSVPVAHGGDAPQTAEGGPRWAP